MAWIDGVFLVVLLLSVLIGVIRGLLFELMSIMGWFAAYLAATLLASALAPHVPIGQPGSAANHAAAFAATFLAVLIVWAIASRVLRLLIHSSPLSVMDRALGAVFGGVRGALLLLAITTAVSMTPAVQSQSWRASLAAPWLAASLSALMPLLPHALSQHLPA